MIIEIRAKSAIHISGNPLVRRCTRKADFTIQFLVVEPSKKKIKPLLQAKLFIAGYFSTEVDYPGMIYDLLASLNQNWMQTKSQSPRFFNSTNLLNCVLLHKQETDIRSWFRGKNSETVKKSETPRHFCREARLGALRKKRGAQSANKYRLLLALRHEETGASTNEVKSPYPSLVYQIAEWTWCLPLSQADRTVPRRGFDRYQRHEHVFPREKNNRVCQRTSKHTVDIRFISSTSNERSGRVVF